MSRRRSSIRGKGAEILFGVPPAVEIQPRTSGPALVDVGSPAPESVLQAAFPDAKIERALLEEARRGAPLATEDSVDQLAAQADPPVTEETEAAPIKEATVAGGQPEPLAEVPIPTLEVTMEEQDLVKEAALY